MEATDVVRRALHHELEAGGQNPAGVPQDTSAWAFLRVGHSVSSQQQTLISDHHYPDHIPLPLLLPVFPPQRKENG